MRIAVSGTHCTGKSTLIDEFLRVHPDFVYEPEPYTVLVEEHGEEFSAEPRVEDFLRQLQFNIDRLKQHERGERVIYERCPVDFLAYIECVAPRTTSVLNEVLESMPRLEMIVYLPIDHTIETEEFPKLRKAVDRLLIVIYREEGFAVSVIEATGPTENRLRILEAALKV